MQKHDSQKLRIKETLIKGILNRKFQGTNSNSGLTGGTNPTNACQGGGGKCNHTCTGDSPCNGDQTCDCMVSMCVTPPINCREVLV